MIRRITQFTALALALALPLTACDDEPTFPPGSGRVSLSLTDAAGDIQAAVVTISEIYLQGDSGEVVLLDEETTTDLVTLANDIQTLVDEEVVPDGVYGQLRFVITGAYIQVDNGDETSSVYATADYAHVPEELTVDGTLICPSCAQSGLKVDLPADTEVSGNLLELLADFDVSESFGHQAGNSGNWVMHPVIKVSAIEAVGSIVARLQLADTVTLPVIDEIQLTLGDFRARLANADGDETELALTDDDEDGIYEAEFTALPPGEYTLEFVAATGVNVTLDIEVPAVVEVEAGEQAEVGAVVTSSVATG